MFSVNAPSSLLNVGKSINKSVNSFILYRCTLLLQLSVTVPQSIVSVFLLGYYCPHSFAK